MRQLLLAAVMAVPVSALARQAAPSPEQLAADRAVCQNAQRAAATEYESCMAWRAYFHRAERLPAVGSPEDADTPQNARAISAILGEMPQAPLVLRSTFFTDEEKAVVIRGLRKQSWAVIASNDASLPGTASGPRSG